MFRRHQSDFELFDMLGEIYDSILEKCDKLNFEGRANVIPYELTDKLEKLLDEFSEMDDELDRKINPDIQITEKENMAMCFVEDILELYEFEIDTQGKLFRVYDRQGGNLGDIEGDRFENIAEVIDRMGVYHEDYIYRSLEEREEAGEKIEKDDRDLTVKNFLDNNNVYDILKGITTRKWKEKTYRHYSTKDIMVLFSNQH